MSTSVSVVAPRPHPRVVDTTVDGEHVVLHLDDRRLHVLNRSAGAIWAELAEAATIADVAAKVADRFGTEPSTIRADVERMIERFRADGLVSIDDGAPVVRCARPAATPLRDGDRRPGSGCYRALEVDLAIECDDEAVGALLDSVLRPLWVSRRPTTAVCVTGGPDGPWYVAVGGRVLGPLPSRLAVVLRVLAEINDAAVRSVPDDLVFHAGAVADDQGAVLLPAASNHGKSTLTTALVDAGFDYLTDEAAAVTTGLVVRPFAKSIVLDPGSFSLFPDLEPHRHDGGLAKALAGREWHIDPRRVGTVAGPMPVRVVVCPHWRAGASTRVHRCERSEALPVLLGEAFDFAEGGQPVFHRLAELVETVPVYRLGYSDLREAVERVSTLLAQPL